MVSNVNMLRSLFGIVLILCLHSALTAQRQPPMICTGGVVNSKAIYLPIPLYPIETRLSLKAHTVSVRITVNENGWVSESKACSGDPTLRQAAESAAMRAKFKPTLLSGKHVVVSGIINYRFDPATSFEEPYELPCFPTMNIIKIINEFAINLVQPTFPFVRPRLAGHVAVQVLIGEDGRVETARAVSGPEFAREPAVKAAYESKFRRFVACGKPTKLSSILGYNIKEPSR